MSKQDIEKRLGFAAQGVKETTRTSAKATFGGHDAFVVTQNYNGSATGTIKGFDSLQQVQAYIKERRAAIAAKATPEEAKTVSWTIHKTIDEAGNSQTVGTVKFARPGVKAKFADAALERIRKNAAISNKLLTLVAKGMPVPEAFDLLFGEGAYKKLASDVYDELRKDKSSRPGAKAKMGLEMNMLDFRHKFFTAFGTAIRDAKSNPNMAEAQSDEAVLRESWASMFAQGYSDAISDLNGLSATMKSKTSVGQMRKAASDAMETYRQAKAAVRASRPGVKATMAVVKDLKIKPGKDEDSRFFTASIDGVERQGKVVKDWSRLGGWGWVAYINGVETSAGSQTRKTIQDAIRFASEFIKASRPGAKAKMGSSQVNDSATTADLIREAQRLRDVIKTSNREFDKTHLRQIKQELDKRGVLMPYGASEVLASRPGAKAKA